MKTIIILQAAAASSGSPNYLFIGAFLVILVLIILLFMKNKNTQSSESKNDNEDTRTNNKGMANPILVLVIGAVLFIGGYVMKENAKDQMKFGFTYRPPYANAEEARVAQLNNFSGYTQIGGVISAIAGGLWLIVVAIQKKK